MNFEEIKNKNLINYKINELNYEKIKSDNESKIKKKKQNINVKKKYIKSKKT